MTAVLDPAPRRPASWRRRAAVGLAVAMVALAGAALWRWPWLNAVETGRTPAYPRLRPRRYRLEPRALAEATRRAIAELPGWQVVGGAGEAIDATYTTRLGFVDDVRVRITPVEGGARWSARSASRVGEYDFGQNARNLLALIQALDRQLPGKPYDEER